MSHGHGFAFLQLEEVVLIDVAWSRLVRIECSMKSHRVFTSDVTGPWESPHFVVVDESSWCDGAVADVAVDRRYHEVVIAELICHCEDSMIAFPVVVCHQVVDAGL